MSTIAEVAETMQKVLTQVADGAARQTGFIKRVRNVTGASFVQTLVFGWLSKPDATLEDLTQTAAGIGLIITPQGLDDRFTPEAADFMKQVLEEAVQEAIAANPVAIPLLERFNGVYIQDSTTIQLPDELGDIWAGSGGSSGKNTQSAVKVHTQLNFSTGALTGLSLLEGRTHDQKAPFVSQFLPPGSLRLMDLGYFNLNQFEKEGQHTYWLIPLKAHTLISSQAGQQLHIEAWLARQTQDAIDISIKLGAKGLSCRLIARRVSPQVAQERRRKIHLRAREKGQVVSQARLALADWEICVTNVPPTLLSAEEVFVMLGVRWQIELLFKLWKSEGQLDESRSHKPWRVLCEFYAKLLALLIQHWLLIVNCWEYPNRSLTKASHTIRGYAILFAHVLNDFDRLCEAIQALQQAFAVGSRINKSRKTPRTFQKLMCFAADICLT
jgi:hypothetical protein